MTVPHYSRLVLFGTALLALGLTRAVIAMAHRYCWVVRPKADRWSKQTTALYGGVAIFLAFGAGASSLLPRIAYSERPELLGLLLGGICVFSLGLRDDARALNPLVKLLGQVFSVTPFLAGLGLSYSAGSSLLIVFLLAIPLIFVWMLALTNAFNLLDNMDGLSAGTAAIVGSGVALYAAHREAHATAILSALVAAACLGFLCYNFRLREPARIFMGDCGSMFLGYMLAGLAVIAVCHPPADRFAGVAISLLLMALPIFDTSLVIVLRKCEGRAISQGGKDHTSHRLVYAGLSEKQAVLFLYAVSLLTGAAGLVLQRTHQLFLASAVVAITSSVLLAFGFYLSRFSGTRSAVAASGGREPILEHNAS